MRLKFLEQLDREEGRLLEWHTKFIWFPHKTIHEEWVWLEIVERKMWIGRLGGYYYDYRRKNSAD